MTPEHFPDSSASRLTNAGSERRTRIVLSLLFAAAAIAPLLHLLALTIVNYYNFPYYDTWGLYNHIATFMNGDMSWGRFLFSQQVDSRPAVPRLLLFLVHSVNRDLILAVLLNFTSAIATAVMTLVLLRRTNPGISWPALWAAVALFNLNFFSIAQWVNWNWHDAILSFLPNMFFALGWLINTSALRPLGRGLLVSLCCALSSFCFSSGLFQWFVLVPVVVGLDRRKQIRTLGLHFAASLICFVFYLTGFIPGKALDIRDGLFHFGRSVTYFFIWLGSSLSGDSIPVAAIWGAVLLLTFLALAFQCFRIWRTEGLQAGWLPWLSMGFYPLLSGPIAAVGRSHIGLEQALRSRYCTYSQWLIIGIIGLSVIFVRRNWTRKRARSPVVLGLLVLLLAGFLYFQARHSLVATKSWEEFTERMHFQKQSFGLEERQPGQLWTFDYPVREQLLSAYKAMRKAGFLLNTFRSGQVLDLITTHKRGRWSDGDLKVASILPFREIKCRGWSVGGKPNAGNRVLIVLITPEGKILAVGEGPINRKRVDVIRHTRASSRAVAGFDLQFRIPKMTPGLYRLAAFRYGKDEQRYYPIGAPAALVIRAKTD